MYGAPEEVMDENPPDVGLDEYDGLVEGKGEDRRSRRPAHARKFPQGFVECREPAAVRLRPDPDCLWPIETRSVSEDPSGNCLR